jgi:beta-RFAP synthase
MALARPPKLLGTWGCTLPIIHFRFHEHGIHGAQEREIFSAECPLPKHEALNSYAILLASVLSGLIDEDDMTFQQGLSLFQHQGFKSVEWNAQSAVTREFRSHWEQSLPDVALNLSSMGPTMFAVTSRTEEVLRCIDSFRVPPVAISTTTTANGAYVRIKGNA